VAILTKGVDFTTGDQVSATNLDNLVDAATFAAGAVDNSTTQLSGGAIIVKDLGVTMAKLASASNGQIPIGNGGGFTAATLTAGTNIGVTNASGAITVAFSGTLPVANGGTGVTTIADLRTALALGAPIKNTAQLDRTDTTYTDIPGLTTNLVSGTTYTVDVLIPLTASVSLTGIKLTGTATASSCNGFAFYSFDNGSNGTKLVTSFPATVTPYSGGSCSAGHFKASATIVCNGSGTLKLQLAGGASGTTSALLGATMRLFSY